MRINKVTLPQVMNWYQVGWNMWRRDSLHWLLVGLLCLLLGVGGVFTPVLHWVLYGVLPLLIASLYYMARKVVQGKEPSLDQCFFILSLEEQRNQLVVLGLSLMALMVLLSGITHLLEPRPVFNYSLTELAQAHQGVDIQNSFWRTMLSSSLKLLIVAAVVVVLLFAPALILFRKMPAWLAAKTSLKAYWINKGPLSFFLFIQIILTLFALMPLGLGLLLLLPVTVNALYRAYTEIFNASTPKA